MNRHPNDLTTDEEIAAAPIDPEEGLRQGLEDIAEGRTRPAREVFAELREAYGIRG